VGVRIANLGLGSKERTKGLGKKLRRSIKKKIGLSRYVGGGLGGWFDVEMEREEHNNHQKRKRGTKSRKKKKKKGLWRDPGDVRDAAKSEPTLRGRGLGKISGETDTAQESYPKSRGKRILSEGGGDVPSLVKEKKEKAHKGADTLLQESRCEKMALEKKVTPIPRGEKESVTRVRRWFDR